MTQNQRWRLFVLFSFSEGFDERNEEKQRTTG